jgi:Ran GTPase-activating protein (RanGAP) involved in mRNA processing and transport
MYSVPPSLASSSPTTAASVGNTCGSVGGDIHYRSIEEHPEWHTIDGNYRALLLDIQNSTACSSAESSLLPFWNERPPKLEKVFLELLALVLQHHNALTSLNLQACTIENTNVAIVCTALKHNSTTLTALDLSYNLIGDAGAVCIEEFLNTSSRLVTLKLDGNRIGNNGAACICAAIEHNNTVLTTLTISSNHIGEAGSKSVGSMLAVHRSLTRLDIANNILGDAGVASLAAGLGLNSVLIALALSGNNIGDDGMEHLNYALMHNTCLTSLDLTSNRFSFAGLAKLSGALRLNCGLVKLRLKRSRSVYAPAAVKAAGVCDVTSLCAALTRNTVLATLDLTNCVTSDHLSSLSAVLESNTVLTDLNLRIDGATDSSGNGAGIAEFCAALGRNSGLTALNLYGRDFVDDNAVSNLGAALGRNTVMTCLCLGKCINRDAALVGLSSGLGCNSTLTDLDLSALPHASENDDLSGVAALCTALARNNMLRVLALNCRSSIGAAGAASISAALKQNSALTKLTLVNCKITPDGAASISGALVYNSSLTTLNLEGNLIGDTGAACLSAALEHNSTLTDLNLSSNNIIDGGASFIRALRRNISLTRLSLNDYEIPVADTVAIDILLDDNKARPERRLALLSLMDEDYLREEGVLDLSFPVNLVFQNEYLVSRLYAFL